MNFHPDKNLPGCMMPDGGDCCAGHAAVVADWHKQRREIEKLRLDYIELEKEAHRDYQALEAECGRLQAALTAAVTSTEAGHGGGMLNG